MTTSSTESQVALPQRGKVLMHHNAASWDDWVAAAQGQTYTARCGKVCKGDGTFRHRDTLSPIEHCVVCKELTS